MAQKTAPVIELPRDLPDPPTPGEFARMTDRERLHAIGSTLLSVGQALPAIVSALDRHDQGILEANGNACGARSEATRAADTAARAEAKLDAFLRLPPPIPAMRAESPSGLDLRQAARTAASGEFERLARTSDGPHDIVQATPAKLTAVTESVVERVLAAKEAATKAKANSDRLAEIDRRKKEAEDEAKAQAAQSKKNRQKIVMAALLAFAGVIGAAAATRIVSKAEGLAEGRQQGLTEGHDMALKEVRASASAPPAQAPAAMAPR